MNIHDGSPLDGVIRELGIGRVQEAESTRPPLALGIDVRAGGKQHVDHRAAPGAIQGRRIEGADWPIDRGPQLAVVVEKKTGTFHVIGLNCLQ